MRSSVLWTVFCASTFVGLSLFGCGDSDNKPAASKAGESCGRTADCAANLVCVSNVCLTSSTPNGAGGAMGPVLGGIGESCASHTDCAPGLGCFNGRCSENAPAEGGAPGVILGARGETCTVASDCATGLTCIPVAGTSLGRCDIANYGIQPTGKVCGAECTSAADCCELPLGIQTIEGIKSCADLADQLAAVDCTKTTVPHEAELCFVSDTYCACTDSTWTCGDDGLCSYAADCSADNLTTGGCATLSRSGRQLFSTCNADTSKCEPTAPTAQCKKDADCTGVRVFDDAIDTCTDGECTCYTATHDCYRKCAQDLDCAVGKTCDTKTHVCVSDPGCSTDRECATKTGDVTAKCVDSACKVPCTTDHQCSGSGTLSGGTTFNNKVCGPDGFCTDIGCSQDSDCPAVGASGTSPGVRVFCTTAPTTTATSSVSSAITD